MFDWITGAVEQTGYLGIILLMIAENVFPPIPSEVIMPLAGLIAARGDLNIFGVILAGTFGSVVGATFWYYIGLWFGEARLKRWSEKHGRWWTLHPDEVDQASDWFRRYAGLAVLIGRMIPTIRTLISVPAGIAAMPLHTFLFFTTLGTALWISLLATAGYLLESQYERVADYIDPLSNVVVVSLVLIYVYRVVTFHKKGRG